MPDIKVTATVEYDFPDATSVFGAALQVITTLGAGGEPWPTSVRIEANRA